MMSLPHASASSRKVAASGASRGRACMNSSRSPRIHELFAPATPSAKAIDQIEAWLESPTLTLLSESNAHWSELHRLLEGARIAGPQIHDARVAALCIQHGVRELWTADRDFSRFRDFRR